MVVTQKAEPDSCRRSTMRGLKAADQIWGMENSTRCDEIYYIFTQRVVRQKPDFLVSGWRLSPWRYSALSWTKPWANRSKLVFGIALYEGLDKMAFRGYFKPSLFYDIVEFVQKKYGREEWLIFMFRMSSCSRDAWVFENLSLWGQWPVLLWAKIDLSIILLSKNGEISFVQK